MSDALARGSAAPDWVNCAPLDTFVKYPRAVWRLTFTPQNIFLPDRLPFALGVPGDWAATMQVQLDSLTGDSPVMPVQGTPTALENMDVGRVGTFDVMAKANYANDTLQSAMNWVESAYGYCKLIRVERLAPPTNTATEDRADSQKADATDAGKKYEKEGPLSRFEDVLDALLILAGVALAVYVLSKLPAAPALPHSTN